MKSAKAIIPFPKWPDRRNRDEVEFLPAALEVLETPPSPIGRAISVTIVGLFCIAVTWASLGHVDIIASASGKIIPTGRTKVIQPFETGVVRAIYVRDGQTVKAGDVLIELDPTINQADRNRLQSDLIAAQLDIARLQAALSGSANPTAEFRPPAAAPLALVRMQQRFLTHQAEEFRAKLAALDLQRAQKEAERNTIGALVEKLEATIPVVQQRVDIRRTLHDKELTSKLTYLESYQLLIEQQRDLAVQKSRYSEAEAALAAITETRAQAEAEFRRTLYGEMAEAERKAASLAEDLIKAEQKAKLQVLAAPIDGIVQQLAMHTVGGVVTTAQPLLVVVPVDSHLEIEAMVSNRDIGFVKAGQDAEIKIDTFNFTRYGLLRGKVLSVSRDSIMRDKPQDRWTPSAESGTNGPKGDELVYAARISLDRTQMQIEDQLVNLSPGMAVTAEIKTGTRTVISYLLSPLTRYKQETLRER